MNFRKTFQALLLLTLLVNTIQGIFIEVILETVLHFAGLITDVVKEAKGPKDKDAHCGGGILGGTCTVRVYNELTNKNVPLNVVCRSGDDTIGPKVLGNGEQINFSFGLAGTAELGFSTLYYCTVSIPGSQGTITFDVFNGDAPKYDNHWMIRDEGIWLRTDPKEAVFDNTLYYDFARDADQKVKLNSASYRLWEAKDGDNNPTGANILDVVPNLNGCKNVPDGWDDRTSAVTVCDWDCVVLYQWDNCRGETSRREAEGAGCTNFYLTFFDKRTSSVGGCNKKNSGRSLIPLAQITGKS